MYIHSYLENFNLHRNCDGSYFQMRNSTVKECSNRCLDVTMCGEAIIPEDHLKVVSLNRAVRVHYGNCVHMYAMSCTCSVV